MGDTQRVSRSRSRSDRSEGAQRDAALPSAAVASHAPAWASNHVGAPFGLAGVQRKVTIGPAGDAYEREADRVAADVASGRSIAPSAISPIGTLSAPSAPVGQRAAAADDKKKEDKPKPPAVQKAAAPSDKKKDDKPKPPAVQKAAAPDDKKKDDKPKPPAVQKAAAPDDKKKDDKAKPPAVQKAAAPDDKKKDDKPKPPAVQKAAAPDDKKKDDKAKPPAVQKAAAPDDKKKDDKAKPPAVQKAAAPDDKKKDDKAKPPAVQKAAAPDDKKKDDKAKPPAVQKAAAPDDKKKDDKPKPSAVQKAAAPDDKKKDDKPKPSAVQKAEPKQAPDTPREKKKEVQKSGMPEEKKDEKAKAVQRGADGGGASPTPAMESAASRAIQTKGAGEPMHAATRSALEPRLGVDLGGVRVHQGRSAQESADAINARAFTHGSDIWLGRGQSQSDTSLMAHEATHVVQQAGGVHRMVQRAPAAPAASAGPWDYEGPEGKVKKDSELVIPTLRVPTFKKAHTPEPVELPRAPRPDDQATVWEQDARSGSGIDAKLEKKLKAENAPSMTASGQPIYFLQLKGEDDNFVIGNQTAIKNRSLRPFWDKSGGRTFYDVDHKQEHQLGGANTVDNMWLLEATANRSAGSNIRVEKDSRIQTLLDAAFEKQKLWPKRPDRDTVKSTYKIKFEKVLPELPVAGSPAKRWTIDEIKDQARQLDELKVLTKKQIEARGLQGTPEKVVIYTNESGGGIREVDGWKDGETHKTQHPHLFRFGKLLRVHTVKYDKGNKKGSVEGIAFTNSRLLHEFPFEFDIQESKAVDYGGFISQAGVTTKIQEKLKHLGIKALSPVEITQAELTDKGLIARGQVLPTLPLFKDVRIDLVINGDDIYLSKVFNAGDFKFPGPIKVTAASLEIFAGTPGIGARGDVFFEIDRLGKGTISGKGTAAEGFSIAGEFNFDSEMFDPAKVRVEYTNGVFSGSGEIGIKEGKVRGIKSASIKAGFDGDNITASGSVKPDIPGIEQGDMAMSYSPEAGLLITGSLQLKKDIPGIESGSVTAEVSKKPDGDRYIVKAAGEATPKIPGISSKLTVSYDDGAFDVAGTAGYDKGMLKGAITVGATNRPVGDGGVPSGPPPDKGADKITLYGGGTVTLKIAPWLQATAAIKLRPNGEVEVTGKIGLPAVIEIFKEKKLDKNIFKVGVDIPIIGVAAAGQRIGIFANISGGLDLTAGIGPGQLQQLELSVTYNPAHEEETKVVGDAHLHIPAMAGLRLFVRGAVGIGIPLVSASVGLTIGGTLGLEGALDAGVHVEWTPTKGLDLQAEAGIFVEPKFKFDITGDALVELDLLLTTIELYSKKWQLASFEYGSGLRLGMKFPIHYREGTPFDVSLSDVQFEYPKIDPGELLEGLIKKIA